MVNVNSNYGMFVVACQNKNIGFPVGKKKITKLRTAVQNRNSYF